MRHTIGLLLGLASLVCLSAQLWATAPANLGPPAVCLPFDIGEDEAIPEVFSGQFLSTDLVRRTVASLDGSDRTLVHMETLRCATWAVMRAGDSKAERLTGGDKLRLGHELVSGLRWRLVQGLNAEQPLDQRALGLLWFDLAFVQGAMGQALRFDVEGCEQAMTEAMELLDTDASAQFGCALAMWEFDERGPVGFYPRLRRALDLEAAGPVDKDLMTNVLLAADRFLGTETRAELDEKVNQRLAGK